MQETILVTGAGGQIGTELVEKLRQIYGESNVLASDIRALDNDPYSLILDVTNSTELEKICEKYQINQIYH